MSQHHFIFLPGFLCDERLFEAQGLALLKEGHSCAFADMTKGCSIEALAKAALEICAGPIVPVGLSMGGIIALEMARQAPSRITHLALLNTTFRADAKAAERKGQIERVREGEMTLIVRDELKPAYLSPANRTKARIAMITQMAIDLGEEVFERQSKALMKRGSYAQFLPEIACPTLVLTGEDDTVCPPDLHREMARKIGDAKLQILAQCGHLSSIERPDEVTKALLDLVATKKPQSLGHRAADEYQRAL